MNIQQLASDIKTILIQRLDNRLELWGQNDQKDELPSELIIHKSVVERDSEFIILEWNQELVDAYQEAKTARMATMGPKVTKTTTPKTHRVATTQPLTQSEVIASLFSTPFTDRKNFRKAVRKFSEKLNRDYIMRDGVYCFSDPEHGNLEISLSAQLPAMAKVEKVLIATI